MITINNCFQRHDVFCSYKNFFDNIITRLNKLHEVEFCSTVAGSFSNYYTNYFVLSFITLVIT